MPDETSKSPEPGDTLPLLPFKLQLRTLKSARRSLARVIRGCGDGTITPGDARTVAWLLSVLLAYFKEAAAVELSDRLAAVEKRIKQLEIPNAGQNSPRFK